MDLTRESKACCACARAKRKCGKQIPTCGRCQSRGIRCDYATARSSLTSPPDREVQMSLDKGAQPDFQIASRASAPTQADALDALLLDTNTLFHLSGDDNAMHIDGLFSPNLNVSIPSSIASFNPKSSAPPLPRYLAPDSWEFDHHDTSDHGPPYCSDVLNSSIKGIQEWLVTWVRTGACPFIHTRTYKHQSPRCVQDAYTTLSTYQNRTPENKAIIAVLVEERINQLRNDQPTPISGAEDNSSFLALTPFEHLARVHALLVYQAIGLYDGDIRLRHVAETQVPTLNSWLRQLIKSAQSAAREGPEKFIHSLLFPSNHTQRGPILSRSTTRPSPEVGVMTNISAGSILSPEDIAWYAWLFAETIRRTWIAACTIQTVYLTLQVGWAPCPGGVPITARDGLFSADSAYAWSSKCGGTEKHEQAETDFVRRGQSSWIFEQRSPEDVDEFARLTLEITFGLERVERWRIMKGEKG